MAARLLPHQRDPAGVEDEGCSVCNGTPKNATSVLQQLLALGDLEGTVQELTTRKRIQQACIQPRIKSEHRCVPHHEQVQVLEKSRAPVRLPAQRGFGSDQTGKGVHL